jgi:hypothetical protein
MVGTCAPISTAGVRGRCELRWRGGRRRIDQVSCTIDRIVFLASAPNLPADQPKSSALSIVARYDSSGSGPRLSADLLLDRRLELSQVLTKPPVGIAPPTLEILAEL